MAQVGGAKNVKLRQAISLSIDRKEISDKVYEGIVRTRLEELRTTALQA